MTHKVVVTAYSRPRAAVCVGEVLGEAGLTKLRKIMKKSEENYLKTKESSMTAE